MRVLFQANGRPRWAVRRVLFHKSGRPRNRFRHIVMVRSGEPRPAFAKWFDSDDFTSFRWSPRRATWLTRPFFGIASHPLKPEILARLEELASKDGSR